MARIDVLHHALNIGVFDRDKLHRVDLERMRLAAERQTNIMCDAVGKGFLRPGTEHIGILAGATRPLPFIAGDNDAFSLLLSDYAMQVHDGSTDLMVTRPSVTTAVTSGTFSASTGWTLASTSGQSTTISGGKLNLKARAHGGKAKATQQVTVTGSNVTKEHALRIVVDRGPVSFRVGSTSGGDEYVAATDLRKGEHSLAFVPLGDFYIEFSSQLPVLKIVDSCTIEAAGVMVLPTIWAEEHLGLIRQAQSLDVMFCAADGYKEQRVERRSDRSWSVCDYDRDDGPFQAGRSADVKLTPSVTEGNGTLTASAPFFRAEHVGAIFRIFHQGQQVETWLAGADEYTDPFLVTGITETDFEERKFTVAVTGTWAGTLRHSRSYDGKDGSYHDYRRAQTVATIDITANASYTNDDNDDNLDVWVRMGFPPGLYTSGEAAIAFAYPNGGGFGICRVVGFTSTTVVDIEVLTPFKGKTASSDWREGRWSGAQGYPAAVALSDGRLDWSGNDLFDASISDAYESFDEDFEGEAGPLSRSIALGGRNDVRWMLPLSSLMIGCDSRIANVRASSLDEILTPANFGIKSSGKIGAAPISPIELADDRAVFVQNSGNTLYEITWSAEKARYISAPFSKLTTNLFLGGIAGMDVQVLPDQRIWVANTDADATCIVFEPTEQVLAAHVPISTSTTTDFFEAFCVLPGTEQDRVYAVVRRLVDTETVYHYEKFALDREALVDNVCKVMDDHVSGTGAHSAVIDGLEHLEGRVVVAWVDGAPVTDPDITNQALDNSMLFTVSGGMITLPEAPTLGWCVGLRFVGQYKSARLAYGVEGYTPMLKNKSIAALGLMLGDFVRSGVRYGIERGNGFSAPWSMPLISSATGDMADEVVGGPMEDEYPFPTDSGVDLDCRICLEFASPKPASVLSLVLAIETFGR